MLTLHPEALLENVDTWDDAGVIWNWVFYVSQGMTISTVRAKLSKVWSFELEFDQKFFQKNLCASILGIPSLITPPIDVTIVIKAKASTTAIVMQPAVNLQLLPKLFSDTCTIEENSIWALMPSTFGHRNLQSPVDCSMSVFVVICVYTHEQWEGTIWVVGIGSLRAAPDSSAWQQVIRIPWQQPWSTPSCPADGNLIWPRC